MRTENLLDRFDAWEALTRGLRSKHNRVSVEPVYRPLLGRERIHKAIVDDARKPGLIDRFRHRTQKEPTKPDPVAPAKPEPFQGPTDIVELQLLLSQEYNPRASVGGALLRSLGVATHHIGFELIGTADKIIVQIACDQTDVATVRSSLGAYVPEARVVKKRGVLADEWDGEMERFGVIASLGLEERVFRMLRTSDRSDSDALTDIIGRLGDLEDGELGLVQMLFTPVQAPWQRDFEEFASKIEDIDKVLPLIRAKFAEPTFATVIRVSALALDEETAVRRARLLVGAVVATTRSPSNQLTILPGGKHNFETEAVDILERQTLRPGMLLSLGELQTLVHVPAASIRSERLVRQTGRSKRAPAIVADGELFLGVNEHDGNVHHVTLSQEQRTRHMHLIGATGSGKSTLLLSMAIQDIEQGNGFAVLDPHGDLIEDIIARIPEERAGDVILIDPADDAYPMAFNILSARSEIERTLLASDFVGIFRRLSSTTFGDVMVTVLGNAVLAILESSEGGTLIDLRRFLIDKDFRHRFLKTVSDEEVVRYWREEFPLLKGLPHASILTRLNTFLRPKALRYMVAQRDDRLSLRSVMDEKKILLVKLSHGLIGEENAHLLGSLLVAKVALAAMSRQDTDIAERTPFTLYLDEFHHFVTPSVATILTSVRKYKLSLCLAHHEMRQLRSRSEEVASAVLANAYTRIVFRVGEQDARILAEGFSYFEPKDFQGQSVGHAIARVERSEFDFNLRTALPAPIAQTLKEARLVAVRSASRRNYATPRAEVEVSLKAATQATERPEPVEAADKLEPREKTKKERAQRRAESTEPTLPGRGGAEHKYIQSLIRRLAEDRGYSVSLEKTVLDGHGYVDVLLERGNLTIACEISVTTRVSHELSNLSKCLAAGFTHVVLVSSNEQFLNVAKAELRHSDANRLRFLSPDALIGFLDELGARASESAVAKPTQPPKKDTVQHLSGEPFEGQSETKRMLNTRDAAAYLGLAVQTLAKLRVNGGSPPYHKLGRQVLYDRSDLEKWLTDRRRRSTSDKGSRLM